MTSTECIERKNQPQAEINETETITSIKSNEELVHWKKKTERLTICSQINQMKRREENE